MVKLERDEIKILAGRITDKLFQVGTQYETNRLVMEPTSLNLGCSGYCWNSVRDNIVKVIADAMLAERKKGGT